MLDDAETTEDYKTPFGKREINLKLDGWIKVTKPQVTFISYRSSAL
jgi:hypothetical protein